VRRQAAKDKLSDEELLGLSGKGDEEAFLILYRRHQGPVFRFALHMSGKQETAEEVTQEVFVALLARASRYSNEQGTLQGYLIGAARNQVRRQLRDARKNICEAIESSSDSGEYLLDELGREQELSALRRAILNLPVKYREIIVLCDLEGMEYERAAEQLGCAVGTVRSRLHRARKILQMKLRRLERCPA
jgi:RNA polymerase sigma-70 factor (ECF subfamily)